METAYTYCALIGGILVVLQFLLMLVGLGHHGDFDFHGDLDADVDTDGGDHGGAWFVGILSFRSITAAIAVFGLAGLAASSSQSFGPLNSLLIAVVAGGSMLYAVGWMLKTIYRLGSEGTFRIDAAVGETGSVYLSIPGQQEGAGKVTLTVEGRTLQLLAMTAEEELPFGTPVVVTEVLDEATVEVAKADEPLAEEQVHVES